MNNFYNNFYKDFNLFLNNSDVYFMNHGYSPYDHRLKTKDLKFKNQATLYLSLFDNIETENKSILEVGCGRGGGINLLNNYFNFSKVDACDINKENIECCQKNHSKNINFAVCSAEKLNYPDESFDILINVESSHCYKNFWMFFNEVKRVLKPGGLFLYTDCGVIIQNFEKYSKLFNVIKKIDITKNVKNSCKEDIENYEAIEDNEISNWFIGLAKAKHKEYSWSENRYITYICSKKINDNEQSLTMEK